ncbi:MAG TPA: 1-deoxy-D-xylulose-5-phosphate synthase [Tenericutes bacterium]|nr:1-deoxy-D-xylulose-5-phosphate synthase [Mycoplasmatota bacterium]
MDVTKIKDPKFLKDMDEKELTKFSNEIRNFLIESLSKTGGHISSNLGIVELTIALHKVFDSPNDKFIFDVGHQTYVHKILTGRAKDFHTLRQYKGLCGFPKKSESKHDVWETGHSSTSLSAAIGMAVARDLRGTNEFIIPIIGDGALTGGMAYEALNHIGNEGRNIIVILNDNEMSIAPNVGAIHGVLTKLRTAERYNKLKEELESFLRSIPKIGDSLAARIERFKDSIKYLFVAGMFFEDMGFTYLGPVDGHSFHDLIQTLNYAKKIKGPVIVHVLTKKGKGYIPAENDKVGHWHGAGPYKIETGDMTKTGKDFISWSEVVSNEVLREARKNKKIVAITPAMKLGSKLEKFAEEFPDRFFDVGIAEEHAITFAGGLAESGFHPFVAIYSTFLQRAYDQILHDICRQNLPVLIGIDRSGLVGADGETHHGVFDIAFLRHIPNIIIMMPKDIRECNNMIYTAFRTNSPVAIRFPRGSVKREKEIKTRKKIPIGKWEVLCEGEDIVILAFGPMLELAFKAKKHLAKENISVCVINARFIKPLDEELLFNLGKKEVPILTIEESILHGGFGSAVLEFLSDNNFSNKVGRIGIPDCFVAHGDNKSLLKELGITKEKIIKKIKELLK